MISRRVRLCFGRITASLSRINLNHWNYLNIMAVSASLLTGQVLLSLRRRKCKGLPFDIAAMSALVPERQPPRDYRRAENGCFYVAGHKRKRKRRS